MTRVSVLFPTTGRPDRAESCLRRLRETAVGHELEVIAAVDADPETAQRIEGLVDVLVVSPEYRGCSAGWNACLAESSGDPVIFAADDLIWGEGWLDAALAGLEQLDGGWGLVGFNDGHWDGNELATHYLMSRRFIVEVLGGVVAWDFYEHSFNDVEVNERAKRAGRFHWAADAHVGHEHWTYGDRPQDATDSRTLGRHAESEQRYRERAAAGFPTDYEPVITE